MAGLNKHFHMLCIQNRFLQLTGLSMPTSVLWRHLESLYDLEALVSKVDWMCWASMCASVLNV